MFLKSIVAVSVLFFSGVVTAAEIRCTAQVFESFPDGTVRNEKVPLTVENENALHLTLSVDFDGKAFTLSGPKAGPYFVSITEEPDYTRGSLTTAAFSQEGRLQLSVVNQRRTHKLECFNK